MLPVPTSSDGDAADGDEQRLILHCSNRNLTKTNKKPNPSVIQFLILRFVSNFRCRVDSESEFLSPSDAVEQLLQLAKSFLLCPLFLSFLRMEETLYLYQD